MARIEHVELDALHADMVLLVDGREFGRLEDVVPQPDALHPLRLITRRVADNRLVAVPIEWVEAIDHGRIVLVVRELELADLPEYVPAALIPGRR